MKEKTVYESEDGRRFESADECLQWEGALAQIRKIRKKLWEAKAQWFRTEYQYGEEHIRGQIGTECTDQLVLNLEYDCGEVERELGEKFGNLRTIDPADAIQELDFIKRTFEFAFGD